MVMSKMPIKPVGLTGNMFLSNSLWARTIKAIHGSNGLIGTTLRKGYKSCWTSIIREMESLSKHGINVMQYMHIKLGDGESSKFWYDNWCEDGVLKDIYPRVYALELCKNVTVAAKLRHVDLSQSFRRQPRGDSSKDRWTWKLEKSGEFSVASIRKLIDDKTLPSSDYITRWNKSVPIKIRSYVLTVKWAWKPRVIYFSRVEWLVMYLNLLLAGGMCPLKIATLMTNGLSGLIPCDCLRRTSRCWKAFFISLGGSFGGSETTRSSKIPLQRRCYFLTSYNVNHFFGVVIGVTICSVGTIG
ncbi:hypothetical protein Tco_1469707 [Tanacetum coccineum]